MKILILCTGNSCRSQIAEGFLKFFIPQAEIYSAGTFPAQKTHELAVQVMSEINIDISNSYPKNVDKFINHNFDYVITVCNEAKDECPTFSGNIGKKINLSFIDPATAQASGNDLLTLFRNVRDQIRNELFKFYMSNIAKT